MLKFLLTLTVNNNVYIFAVEISFKTNKLAKTLNSGKLIIKHFGSSAKKIKIRLDDMANVGNLEILMTLPGRHHPLSGDRKGQFACDLVHPFRLIYEPNNNPLPLDDNNILIYNKVTSVEIIEITDYH